MHRSTRKANHAQRTADSAAKLADVMVQHVRKMLPLALRIIRVAQIRQNNICESGTEKAEPLFPLIYHASHVYITRSTREYDSAMQVTNLFRSFEDVDWLFFQKPILIWLII